MNKKFSILILCLLVFGALFIQTDLVFGFEKNTRLLKEHGSGKVYVLAKARKYWIRSPEIFNSYQFDWKNIKETSVAELIKYSDAKLISKAGDSKVYYIADGKKRWIATPQAFNANGFDWQDILQIGQLDFDSYLTSKDISGDLSQESSGTVTVEMQAITDINAPQGVDFSPLWETWKQAESKFVDKDKLNKQEMVNGAIKGMLKATGDPYTVFFDPKEAKKFSQDVTGYFGGIGAELGYKNGIVIVTPLKNTPAEKAGIQAGDKILAVDGESFTDDTTVEEAVTKIRGEKGTKVILTVKRKGVDELLEFSIIRDTIKVPTVEWEKKGADIAHIKVFNFFGKVDEDFHNAIKEALAQGNKRIILDLRNNPGGILDAAINMSSEFIPKSGLIVSEDFGEKQSKNEFRSFGGGLAENVPTVVLINGGSASASEIVAGALKDSRGIKLIGEKTFGKGSIQEIVDIKGGGSLKITIAKWIRPSGKTIEGEGVTPDITIELTDADKTAGRDPQLDKAMQEVNLLPLR